MKMLHKTADPRRILIPPPIKAGDLVGVVAASGPPIPELLSQGIRFIQEKGFSVREGCHLRERNAYLAGEDSQRCQDLNSMLRDPEIRAIFFARGGYGVMRLLDSIDHDAIMDDPKILLGMSDRHCPAALALCSLRPGYFCRSDDCRPDRRRAGSCIRGVHDAGADRAAGNTRPFLFVR